MAYSLVEKTNELETSGIFLKISFKNSNFSNELI